MYACMNICIEGDFLSLVMVSCHSEGCMPCKSLNGRSRERPATQTLSIQGKVPILGIETHDETRFKLQTLALDKY
jgi:hypothetical protein